MSRRYVLGMVGAALLALIGIGVNAGDVAVKASERACACCGAACACTACTCDATAREGAADNGCDCCGGAACCSATAKVAHSKVKNKACREEGAEVKVATLIR